MRIIYIGKLKISLVRYGWWYLVGFTYIPKYNMFEINLGKYAINFWYRKE